MAITIFSYHHPPDRGIHPQKNEETEEKSERTKNVEAETWEEEIRQTADVRSAEAEVHWQGINSHGQGAKRQVEEKGKFA
jgi:hypothetical protein